MKPRWGRGFLSGSVADFNYGSIFIRKHDPLLDIALIHHALSSFPYLETYPHALNFLRRIIPSIVELSHLVPAYAWCIDIVRTMGDVFGLLGICLGGLSFILSTVPAAAKFATNYKESKDQVREYESRFRLCQAKYIAWEKHWRVELDENKGIGEAVAEEIKDLTTIIERAIEKHTRRGREREAWHQMKARLKDGVFQLPRVNSHEGFGDKLRHALWRKDILDGWLLRLEDTIAVAEKLLQEDYRLQTAGHRPDTITPKRANELRQINNFFGKLNVLATELHTACIKTCPDGTKDWALGLRPPSLGLTVSEWQIPTPVDIDMRFTVKGETSGNAQFHLKACYEPDNAKSHTTQGAIQLMVAQALGPENQASGHPSMPDCHSQYEHTRTTISIGTMLKERPNVLGSLAWQVSRPELIYGVSEWALLLWDTPWLKDLCCYGLTVEVDECPFRCTTQTLSNKPKNGCSCRDHTSRLRNLGLVLAQLILDKPIRQAKGDNLSVFEVWTDAAWKTMYLSRLNRAILDRTNSTLVQDAIYFCLQPDSELPMGDFKMGYLYMCIDRIFRP